LQEEVAQAFYEFFEVDAVGGFAGVFREFCEFHFSGLILFGDAISSFYDDK